MSFFFKEPPKKRGGRGGGTRKTITLSNTSKDDMHRHGCKLCPLNRARILSPKMEATGPKDTDLYMLGEAPGEEEDKRNEQFVGKAGQIIRGALRGDDDEVRWNNTINCRPPKNRNPTVVEMECCRPRVESDIALVKPYGIVGTGNIPLKTYLGLDTISNWRGLRFPVKIGGHVCWYFPVFHPSYLARNERKNKRTGRKEKTELDYVFQRDMDRIVGWLKEGEEPEYLGDLTKDEHLENVQWVFGDGRSDLAKVEKWLDRLVSRKSVGFDWETTHIRPYEKDSRILTVGIGTDRDAVAFPLDHPKAWTPKLRRIVMDMVKEFILYSGKKIAHSLEFELEWGAYHLGEDILYDTEWSDTWAYSYALDERKLIHSLDKLCFRYFGFWLKQFSNVDRTNMINEPLEKVLPYNALDAKYTWKLEPKLIDDIEAQENGDKLLDVAREIIEVSPAIVATQMEGLRPNWDAHKKFKREFEKTKTEVLDEIMDLPEVINYERQYGQFSPMSNPNVKTLLKDMLHRKEGYRNKKTGEYDYKGKYSVDEDVLSSIPEKATRLPRLTLDLRQANKLESTYCGALDKHVFIDGLIHAAYKTKWVSTLRTACEDPNMQNWPKKRRKDLRSMIMARAGYLLYTFDYGQIQARGIAMMSKDPGFCEALWKDLDIHRAWAERMYDMFPRVMDNMIKEYGKNPREISDDEAWKVLRDASKNRWVFPQFFGSAKVSCQENLKLPGRVATELYDWFWESYAGVKDWHKFVKEFYREHGYVSSPGGSTRREPLGMNELINSPIQGLERDIVIRSWIETFKAGFIANLEVHDDLSFELPDNDEGEEIADEIAQIMSLPGFDWINVPILVEVSRGKNWYEMEDWKEYSSVNFGHTQDNTIPEILR